MVLRLSVVLLFASTATVGMQTADHRFGSGPWIFLQRGTTTTAAPQMRYTGRPLPRAQIRLDDGRIGMMTIEQSTCAPTEPCPPPDCGCFAQDRYQLSLADGAGRVLARTYLWAAYGFFDIVAADLIAGPGDELLIVRRTGRSSPPNGLELKILQIVGDGVDELLSSHQIAGNFSGRPMVCGQWRGRVTIDAIAHKPRSLNVRHDVIVPDGCALDEPAHVEAIQRVQWVLTYAGSRYAVKTK